MRKSRYFFQIQTESAKNEPLSEMEAHKLDLETEKEIGTEISENEFFQGLLGLRANFFTNWKEDGIDFKNIKQGLRQNFEDIDFEENQDSNFILEKIGFDCDMAKRLGRVFGPEPQDPNILWQKIQSFIEVRLDALVVSHPEWSKSEQTFYVFNSNENKNKQFQSIIIPSQKGLNGNGDSLKMLIEAPLDDPPTTETWYHATTFRDALEIMKNGFRFRSCMKNRNFSDQDGIYFTDSISSAKHLFQHNAFKDFVVYPDIEYNKKRKTKAEQNQHKIAVLAFTYHKEKNNLLETYKKHSIDLRGLANEERLKKIVRFFSKHPLPTSCPTIEEHGLHKDYANNIEYIIGPHAIISCSKVYVDRDLTQLCVRCVGRRTYMKEDFENLIQKEVFVLEVDANDFCKLS